ncbi:TetR/AcrR family transcriptional regulator [Burkholderia sp. NRF60-BP8]|uniref:TetR/AcrR family transcriptional regulator n=1 Tax=Burkholderia sp. NRF60-BP8 TaxID=1637853 RepID=UPI0007576B29|nr:TetR/AcrR family transcriptional regulator [Burkholderia sp. NRF60-BP8]AOI76956.1 TetR family transcriptional regulator [Burkholderia sp. NRF60-BP8]KVA16434.1 TetR family transcriptional regulator [Burkholderia sp. NRF60-BP8]
MKKTVKTGAATTSGPARTRRPTQAERSQATRECVIAAAISLLHKEGYSGATTLAIRREADVSMGAMQHQFPTKAELMAAVLERLTGERLAKLEHALRGAETPLERIDGLLDAAGALIGSPLFAASMEIQLARRADEELDEAATRILAPFEARFRTMMDEVTAGLDAAIVHKINQFQLLAGATIRGLTVDVVRGAELATARAAFRFWCEMVLRQLADDMAQAVPAAAKAAKRRVSR